jgi:hypothetical protein
VHTYPDVHDIAVLLRSLRSSPVLVALFTVLAVRLLWRVLRGIWLAFMTVAAGVVVSAVVLHQMSR